MELENALNPEPDLAGARHHGAPTTVVTEGPRRMLVTPPAAIMAIRATHGLSASSRRASTRPREVKRRRHHLRSRIELAPSVRAYGRDLGLKLTPLASDGLIRQEYSLRDQARLAAMENDLACQFRWTDAPTHPVRSLRQDDEKGIAFVCNHVTL